MGVNSGRIPQLDFPLRGVWKAIRSPGHHRFAYDFAASGEDQKLFSVSTAKLLIGKASVDDSYGWSKPVYSPVDGKIVAASDGWPDQQGLNLVRNLIRVFAMSVLQAQKVREDLRTFAGNYVIIASDGYYVLLAHLREGSLMVTSGQSISRGEQVANVGNSGNSAAPHLHLQVNDDSNPLDSKIKEFRFTRYDCWMRESWETKLGTAPEKGTLIRYYD
ncbi:MAG: M23 family metallopeptidase [Anaerolineales bacterium]